MEINWAVFDQFLELKTNRLTLRALTLPDARRIFQMRASSRLNEFIARENIAEPKDAEALVEKVNQTFKDKKGIAWCGILRGQGDIIGTCGFNHIDAPNLHAEIGGELAPEYWGKGIAQEAVEAIVRFGLETLNLHTIEAKVDPRNRGAIYLMEQLGFVKEAHYRERVYFKGEFRDMAVYSLINKHKSPR